MAESIIWATIKAILIMCLLWYVIQLIADWKIFKKAGKPGWYSIIPLFNIMKEYEICWRMSVGVAYLITLFIGVLISQISEPPKILEVTGSLCTLIATLTHFAQSYKLSKAFEHGFGFAVILIILGPLGRIILGFGNSKYIGPQILT